MNSRSADYCDARFLPPGAGGTFSTDSIQSTLCSRPSIANELADVVDSSRSSLCPDSTLHSRIRSSRSANINADDPQILRISWICFLISSNVSMRFRRQKMVRSPSRPFQSLMRAVIQGFELSNPLSSFLALKKLKNKSYEHTIRSGRLWTGLLRGQNHRALFVFVHWHRRF
jgi:hypothetical protein